MKKKINKAVMFQLLYVLLIIALILFMIFMAIYLRSNAINCVSNPIAYAEAKNNAMCYCINKNIFMP